MAKKKAPTLRIEMARRTNRRLPRKLLLNVVKRALADSGLSWEVSLAVVGDEEIARLNKQYLGKARPTDVLSFRLDDEGDETAMGQIVISADTAAREALAREIPFRDEIALYAAHGALHLLGHLDGTAEERRRMMTLEFVVLSDSGISRPQE
ncbi:MAG TPA: rRNA maturation RNase YbeY [Candidatus Brocadiia bacterium]|nr:rRNA maturation RNase YbeY [Candidatus Brocadiia bacterium]